MTKPTQVFKKVTAQRKVTPSLQRSVKVTKPTKSKRKPRVTGSRKNQ